MQYPEDEKHPQKESLKIQNIQGKKFTFNSQISTFFYFLFITYKMNQPSRCTLLYNQ